MSSQGGPPGVAGIILAAGTGSRMGGNKMRLPLGGETLVRRAARVGLAADLSPLVVVLGYQAEETAAELEGLRCETVLNPEFTGPSSGSLHRGLQHLSPAIDAAVVLLGDMVFVTVEMVQAVREAAEGTDAPLIVSRYGGEVTAPPILFRRALFPELLEWTGEGCGKAVVRNHSEEAAFLDWPREALGDVDTPEDYERARERIRQELADDW